MNMIPLKDISEERIFDLIEKLDVRGPRYTSYPTVPVWKTGDFTDYFIDSLKRISVEGKPVAVYMHLPYCNSRCFYCGCNSCITRDHNKFRSYIDSLKREIDIASEYLSDGVRHCQLHLGGGTPTHFPPDMLAGLLDYFIERVPGSENVDRSVEVDPRVTTDDHLRLLSQRRFRRISAGLQDLNADVQKAVNRIFTADKMKRFVDSARDHGFIGVNIDLIYGLPLQNRKTWAETMKAVLQFDPDRLACFGYAHLPSKIKHQRAIRENDLPSSRERLGMLLDANRFFAENGYEAVGMDHFAKPDDELARAKNNGRLWRNFMGYTDIAGLELLGLGCSAISEFKNLFVQNQFPPEQYEDKLAGGHLPIVKGYKLDADDIIRKKFINHLMCNLKIRIPFDENGENAQTIGDLKRSLEKIGHFEDEGLMVPDAEGFAITPLGQLFLRNIAMPFDRYLSTESVAAFSKTV
ncbi:MAG: oxygen-independent coproporphyrinogen III oxidase [Candidatus Zixiibacteriota bacterium]|nr:MAG: oxygen-independent coproporphyrinogen III oxidase [candidate division Zixibacteria bacterium]